MLEGMAGATADESPDVCSECRGRGWIVVADGASAGKARACSCRDRDAVKRLLGVAGIPPRYRHSRLSNFHTSSGAKREGEQLLQARSLARRYVDEFVQPGGGFRESGLLFQGPPGAGKTHLAVAILIELIERYRVRGRFAEFPSLLFQIQSTFDPGSPESQRQILNPLAEAEILVLDELGSQKTTPWVRDILYLIINGRYTRRLPTLFTTNFRLEAADGTKGARGRDMLAAVAQEVTATSLAPPLISRLYEMAQVVALTEVEDFRREHKVHGAHLR
jgi:DNA replication protein DnaC